MNEELQATLFEYLDKKFDAMSKRSAPILPQPIPMKSEVNQDQINHQLKVLTQLELIDAAIISDDKEGLGKLPWLFH